jgi:hypothetical protein
MDISNTSIWSLHCQMSTFDSWIHILSHLHCDDQARIATVSKLFALEARRSTMLYYRSLTMKYYGYWSLDDFDDTDTYARLYRKLIKLNVLYHDCRRWKHKDYFNRMKLYPKRWILEEGFRPKPYDIIVDYSTCISRLYDAETTTFPQYMPVNEVVIHFTLKHFRWKLFDLETRSFHTVHNYVGRMIRLSKHTFMNCVLDKQGFLVEVPRGSTIDLNCIVNSP